MRPDQCHGHKENSPAPLRFALVPVNPNSEQLRAMRLGDQTNNRPTYAEVLSASPGNDLLQRIVRARDICNDRDDELSFDTRCCQLLEILSELGGGHG